MIEKGYNIYELIFFTKGMECVLIYKHYCFFVLLCDIFLSQNSKKVYF